MNFVIWVGFIKNVHDTIHDTTIDENITKLEIFHGNFITILKLHECFGGETTAPKHLSYTASNFPHTLTTPKFLYTTTNFPPYFPPTLTTSNLPGALTTTTTKHLSYTASNFPHSLTTLLSARTTTTTPYF